MNRWTGISAASASAALLWGAMAIAQTPPTNCERARTPEMVEGQVVKVDNRSGKVTVRGKDGTTHEFEASKETLRDLKTGDQIEAKLREAPKC